MGESFDLLWSGGLLVVVSLAIFALLVRWTRKWTRRAIGILGALAVLAIAAFALFLFDSPALLRLVPLSSAIFLANWLMPLSAILAAVMWRTLTIPPWRRTLTGLGVIAIAAIITFRPLIARKPLVQDRWQRGICMQTTQATCTAAAAATLLKLNGIDSSEAEMSRLSLTTRRGTLFHGAYRGLSLRTRNTPLGVQVVSGSFDELKSLGRPVLVRVGAGRWQKVNERYAKEWGFVPGVTHSVVVIAFTNDGRVEIGDPADGRQFWDAQMLRELWHGIGLSLAPQHMEASASR